MTRLESFAHIFTICHPEEPGRAPERCKKPEKERNPDKGAGQEVKVPRKAGIKRSAPVQKTPKLYPTPFFVAPGMENRKCANNRSPDNSTMGAKTKSPAHLLGYSARPAFFRGNTLACNDCKENRNPSPGRVILSILPSRPPVCRERAKRVRAQNAPPNSRLISSSVPRHSTDLLNSRDPETASRAAERGSGGQI